MVLGDAAQGRGCLVELKIMWTYPLLQLQDINTFINRTWKPLHGDKIGNGNLIFDTIHHLGPDRSFPQKGRLGPS